MRLARGSVAVFVYLWMGIFALGWLPAVIFSVYGALQIYKNIVDLPFFLEVWGGMVLIVLTMGLAFALWGLLVFLPLFIGNLLPNKLHLDISLGDVEEGE